MRTYTDWLAAADLMKFSRIWFGEQLDDERTHWVIMALVEECGWTEADARAFVAENPREGGES